MWQHFKFRPLQQIIGEERLEFLQAVIGYIDPELSEVFLGHKSRLAELAASLHDHTHFRNQHHLASGFEMIPDDILDSFKRSLGLTDEALVLRNETVLHQD